MTSTWVAAVAAGVLALDEWQRASLYLLLTFAAARLIELAASTVRARLARAERGAQVVPEAWWPAMILAHAAVLAGSGAVVVARGAIPPRPLLSAAMGAIALAVVLRGWSYLVLGGRWNVRLVDPGDIVTGGPYRFVRHPTYLAVILEVAALPVLVGAYEVALLGSIANGVLLSWRIPVEEQFLASRHRAYREIMLARPRFLPRARPRRRVAGSST